jgi:TfoX/Sxy family transcriptional regulator of competence genes
MKYSEAVKEQSQLLINKIGNLEYRMMSGDKSVTMFDLMSETHKLLNITKPVLKTPQTNTHQNLY